MSFIEINGRAWLAAGLLFTGTFALSCGGGGGGADTGGSQPVDPPQTVATSATVLPGACPNGAGSLPNTTCMVLRIEGQGNAPLDVELRISEPDSQVALVGTVVLSTGGQGNVFYADTSGGDLLIADLLAAGHRVVDRRWTSGWFSTGESLLQQSVRYPTLLEWVHDNVYTTGMFSATGNSLGAVEIAYALSDWNMGAILDRVVLTSGPLFSRIDYACDMPSSAEWVDICTTIVPDGVMECGVPICDSENVVACTQVSANPEPGELEANSLLHAGAVLDYPTTDLIMLLGTRDCTSAVPLALHFLEAVTSTKALAFIQDTPHLLNSSGNGRTAILDALFGVLPTPILVPSMQFQGQYTFSAAESGATGALEGHVYDPATNSVARQVVIYEQR